MEREKYEYRVLDIADLDMEPISSKEQEERFNELGKQGWRLAAVTQFTIMGHYGESGKAYFIRPKIKRAKE